MIRKTLKETSRIVALIMLLTFPKAWAEGGSKAFAFVNARYVLTSEVATAHTFVLNFINLSDFVIVIRPDEFIYKSASGRFYIGQVFESEHKDLRSEMQKYSASLLLKSHSFVGLTIVGAFHEQDQIEEMSVRIGQKRFYLQPMQKEAFEQLAAKIGDLNIESSNPILALEEADISERGSVRNTDGTSEWDRDWQDLITTEGVNPPKIIERPEITPTTDAIRSHTYGRVKLSGIINKNGGIQDLKVVKGLGKGLDERALEGVKNGWIFLPATKNGEVIDTAISIEVDFPAPGKKK
jgi:TonB family protein